jgi:hypothetical protein
MPFIVQGKSADGSLESATIADPVEALRAAMAWESAGFRKVKISADGRQHSISDFAGTIMIGEAKVSQN